jgi:hypothetical protein
MEAQGPPSISPILLPSPQHLHQLLFFFFWTLPVGTRVSQSLIECPGSTKYKRGGKSFQRQKSDYYRNNKKRIEPQTKKIRKIIFPGPPTAKFKKRDGQRLARHSLSNTHTKKIIYKNSKFLLILEAVVIDWACPSNSFSFSFFFFCCPAYCPTSVNVYGARYLYSFDTTLYHAKKRI